MAGEVIHTRFKSVVFLYFAIFQIFAVSCMWIAVIIGVEEKKSRIEICTGIFPGEWLCHRVVIGCLVEQLPWAWKERLFEFLKLE